MAAPAAAPGAPGAAGQYGFIEALTQGGVIAWATLSILVIMSVGSWYVFFVKLIDAEDHQEGRRARTSPGNRRTAEAANKLDKNGAIARSSMTAFSPRAAHQADGRSTSMTGCSARSPQPADVWKLSTGLALLATVGSTAPFGSACWHRRRHLPRPDPHRCVRPGLDRHRRRPGRRGADHDRARSRRRRPGRHAVQLADAPQQGDRRGARTLRQRCAWLHDVRRIRPPGRCDGASRGRCSRPASRRHRRRRDYRPEGVTDLSGGGFQFRRRFSRRPVGG